MLLYPLEKRVGLDINNHERRNWMPAYAIPIQIITTLLLGVRLISRAVNHSRLGFDDLLITLGWILGTLFTAMCLLATYKYGFDRHIWDVPQENWWKGALVAWITEGTFLWSTCFTKISVLLFYRRLVAGTYSLKFKWAIWAAIGFIIIYAIGSSVDLLVQCLPLEASWLRYDPDWASTHSFHCTSNALRVRVGSVVGALSVITDFYSVMLPTALILQIQLNRPQRIGLFFIFGVGFLVVGAGVARLIMLRRVEAEEFDKSWVAFEVFAASLAECNVAIICACAPSLKSILSRWFRDFKTQYSNRSNNSKSNTSGESSNQYSSNGSKLGPSSSVLSTLKRSASRMTATMGGERDKDETQIKTEEEGHGFKMAHEYGLEDLSPVAQGVGDDLVSPATGAHVTADEQVLDERPSTRALTAPEPESFIISPSPSASSDDDVSLIGKNARTEDGIPHKLSPREEDTTWAPNVQRDILQTSMNPYFNPTRSSFHSIGTSQAQTAGDVSTIPPSIGSLQSISQLSSPHAISTNDTSLLPKIQRLSRERWRQVYEKESRYSSG